jgi:ribosomal protein L7/L12
MTLPVASIPSAAIDALRRGNTIEAVKILRSAAPLDLKTAKDMIDAYRRSETLATRPGTAASSMTRGALEAKHAVEQTAVVERMRVASGFGLARAQERIDTARFRDHPHGIGGRSPGETARSGPLLRWIIVVALVGYAFYSSLARSGLHV